MQRFHPLDLARSLNFSDVDLAVTLHFALFHGSGGYVLKPSEMAVRERSRESSRPGGDRPCSVSGDRCTRASACTTEMGTIPEQQIKEDGHEEHGGDHYDEFWPMPHVMLHCTSIEIISLHGLPKVCLALKPLQTGSHRVDRAAARSTCLRLSLPALFGRTASAAHSIAGVALPAMTSFVQSSAVLPHPQTNGRRARLVFWLGFTRLEVRTCNTL